MRQKNLQPHVAMSIRDVAKATGLTRQQVVEAEKRAIKKLRDALRGWR